jgi:hypothetical protein
MYHWFMPICGSNPYDHEDPLVDAGHQMPTGFADYLTMHAEIHDGDTHARQLQINLVDHL